MIKNWENKKVTAKQTAAAILSDNLEIARYWEDSNIWNQSNMSDKEREEVNRHLNELIERLDTILGKSGATNYHNK